MNKTELVEHMAQRADLSKASAARALEAALEAISASLCRGDSVTLAGFGTFEVSQRPERMGRNPRTGTAIRIVPARVPKFRAGKALKDALNNE